MIFLIRLSLVFLSWLFLVQVPLGAQSLRVDTISLDECLALAEQQALGALAARRDLQLVQLEQQGFRASLLPQLNGFANLPNFSQTFGEITQPDGTISFEQIRNNNSNIGLSLQQRLPGLGGILFAQTSLQRFDDFETDYTLYNGLPFRVGIQQPLWQYNSLRWERRLQPLRLTEGQRQYRQDLINLKREVSNAFFDLLLAAQDQRIAQSNQATNQRLYRIAEERYALGNISRNDLLQLEQEQLIAQQASLQAQRQIQTASATLTLLLGEHPGQQSYRAREPELPPAANISEANILSSLRENRPEWTGFERRLLEAQSNLAEARRSGGPSLELNASFGRVRSSTQLTAIYQESLPETFVQLQLNVPILDWGQRRIRKEAAEVELQFTEVAIARDRLSLENEARQWALNYQLLREELRLAERMRDLSEERFRISTESYVLGAISLAELSLAQTAKDQALRTYINSLRSYFLLWNELRSIN